MNKLTLKNGMVYQSGKRIERKDILVVDGIVVRIDEEINEGQIIECDDVLIAPSFKKTMNNIETEYCQGTFWVLYKNLVQEHKVTIERLIDFMSDERIEIGSEANFTMIDVFENQEPQSFEFNKYSVNSLNLQFN